MNGKRDTKEDQRYAHGAECGDEMILLEDTRNKPGMHENILRYCQESGIVIRRSKLYVGDYQIANAGSVAVDTKQGVMELAGNVFQEHRRFRDECIRAQEAGIRLIVLVEETLPNGRLDRWVPPMAVRFDPGTLRKAMYTMQDKYGVAFRFCAPEDTGRVLVEYLTEVRK